MSSLAKVSSNQVFAGIDVGISLLVFALGLTTGFECIVETLVAFKMVWIAFKEISIS